MAERPVLTPRARARAEMTEQIKQIAREHLAVDGPNLSLRAVARDLGVVSSAVYRYFASRDDLLTALILDAYTSLADAVDAAEAVVPRGNFAGRWLAVCRETRAWALAHRHEYALLYGSPVPGYAAPQDTIAPASRPVVTALQILADAVAKAAVDLPAERLAKAVRADMDTIRVALDMPGLPAPLVARAVGVWAQLHGTIGFELYGRLTNGVTDYDEFFDHVIRGGVRVLGLA